MEYGGCFLGMSVDLSGVRHFLCAGLGDTQRQPAEPGVWLVHEYTSEPYCVVVQKGVDEDALHFRMTPSGLNPWQRLEDFWPTKEYPELDIACWKLN